MMNKLKTIFFWLKRNKAQKTVEIEIAFHPKYYPFWKKSLSEYALGHQVETKFCRFINAGFRVFNFNFNYIKNILEDF